MPSHPPPSHSFIDALLNAERPMIMELKPRSAGGVDLFRGRTPADLVTLYEAAGAPCLSVVTGRWFGGTIDLLHEVTERTSLPVLQKDFITNTGQLRDARRLGASAVLLTAALLPRVAMAKLVGASLSLGLTPFVEVATQAEVEAVPCADRCVIAVNNKDIVDRERGAGDIDRSMQLLPTVLQTGTRCPVSASGIDRVDVAAGLLDAGYAGLLVGTGLLRGDRRMGEWLAEFDRCRRPASRVDDSERSDVIGSVGDTGDIGDRCSDDRRLASVAPLHGWSA